MRQLLEAMIVFNELRLSESDEDLRRKERAAKLDPSDAIAKSKLNRAQERVGKRKSSVSPLGGQIRNRGYDELRTAIGRYHDRANRLLRRRDQEPQGSPKWKQAERLRMHSHRRGDELASRNRHPDTVLTPDSRKQIDALKVDTIRARKFHRLKNRLERKGTSPDSPEMKRVTANIDRTSARQGDWFANGFGPRRQKLGTHFKNTQPGNKANITTGRNKARSERL